MLYGLLWLSRKKAWASESPATESWKPAAVSASPSPWPKSVVTVAARCS